jgi:hypothetical protein
MLTAECHCANIKLTASEMPSSLTSCNCSYCNRLGALWAYYARTDVDIVFRDKPAVEYRWGEKTITYHRCGNCGCTTHYTTLEDDASDLVAINCRMAPTTTIADIPIRMFDGLVTWKYLDD